jgi:hypothetical protein
MPCLSARKAPGQPSGPRSPREEPLVTLPAPPHCDSRVLHAPGECEYCDQRKEWQELRQAWGIAFTGHTPKASLPECGETFDAYGERRRCRSHKGHPRGGVHDGHHWGPEWQNQPCPADAARPPGSGADHRR